MKLQIFTHSNSIYHLHFIKCICTNFTLMKIVIEALMLIFEFFDLLGKLRDAFKKKNRKIWGFCPKFIDPLPPPPPYTATNFLGGVT